MTERATTGIAFVLVSALFTYLRLSIKSSGSWRGTAKRFPGPVPDAGSVVLDTSVSIGKVGTLARVVAAPGGLGIQPRWLTGWFLPDLTIPWAAVRMIRRQWLLFLPVRSLILHGDPPTSVQLSRRVWRVATPHIHHVPVETCSPAANIRCFLQALRARHQ